MLIDSHAHLDMEQFAGDRPQVVERALRAGVGEILNVGCDAGAIAATLRLVEEFACVRAAVGLHPHNAREWSADFEARLKRLLPRSEVLAVGETGLDYYRDRSPREEQREVFRRQIALALDFGKPLIVHCREAFEDVIRILEQEGAARAGGVFHAFSGGQAEAEAVLGLGFLVGIGGPLTYPSSRLPAVAAALPGQAYILETDCPYLPPQAHRGKRNEPAYVRLVAERLAEIRSVGVERIEQETEANYRRLMGAGSAG